MPGVLISSDGSHSADQWAVVIAEHIFPVNPAVDGERLMAARRVQNAVVEALAPHFQAEIDREKANLASEGGARLNAAYDSDGAVEDSYNTICALLSGTPWEAKPEDPEWARIMRGELACQFNTVQNIERQWYCHRNPAPESDAFLAQHNLPRV